VFLGDMHSLEIKDFLVKVLPMESKIKNKYPFSDYRFESFSNLELNFYILNSIRMYIE